VEGVGGFLAALITLLVVGILVDILIVNLLTRSDPCRHTFAKGCCGCCVRGQGSTLKQTLKEHVALNMAFAVIVVLQLAITVAVFAMGFLLLIGRSLLSEGCK
jgi:hypothetical protein